MTINSISFGKKIPVANINVKNRALDNFVPATVHEYDCNDQSDINEFVEKGRDWYYFLEYAGDMQTKYDEKNIGIDNNSHFYVTETNNGEQVAVCQTIEEDGNIDIQTIESEHNNKNKYCGKTMLAVLGQKVLNRSGSTLFVTGPLDDVRNFYKDCGFKETPQTPFILEMKADKIRQFVNDVENKTNSKILNIKV